MKSQQAGADTFREVIVTPEMREAGAIILGAPDASFSLEEMAEAVYIAMVREKMSIKLSEIASRPLLIISESPDAIRLLSEL